MSRTSAQSRIAAWSITDPHAYAYLLGCYLGDGHLVHKPPNGWTLKIACDRQYPGIEHEIIAAMQAIFPDSTPHATPRPRSQTNDVCVNHPVMWAAFPQHGHGRKHERPIVLEPWQLAITMRRPESLIRGLIHSDGCRTENAFTTRLPSGRVADYHYVRYFFSNRSADIRSIFRDHCQLLGVRVTQSNLRNLSVSHRHSIAILEEIVGPKH